MNKAEGLTLPNFKLYYKGTIVKTYIFFGIKADTQMKWNRIKSLEINPCIYSQLIHDKGGKNRH